MGITIHILFFTFFPKGPNGFLKIFFSCLLFSTRTVTLLRNFSSFLLFSRRTVKLFEDFFQVFTFSSRAVTLFDDIFQLFTFFPAGRQRFLKTFFIKNFRYRCFHIKKMSVS